MRRWYFWVLAPIMLATGVGLPFIVKPPTPLGYVVVYVFCGALILATLGLASPGRFRWALKGVALVILLAYIGYAVSEAIAWSHGKPFFNERPGDTSLYLALRGLMVFGIPAAYFLLKGRSGTAIDTMIEPGPLEASSSREESPK